MARSREFDREGDPDPKKVVSKTGPLGMVPVFYLIVSILLILAVLLWWKS